MLEHGQDATLSGGIGRGVGFRSLEAQVAYSPVSHIGLMGNFAQAGSRDIENKTATGAFVHFMEGGVGLYQSVGKSCASLFGGYGKGRIFNHYGKELYSRFLIERWFVQPALLYQHNYFIIGVGLRFNYLTYSKGETAFNISEDELYAIRTIEERSPFFLPEAAIQLGMDFSPVAVNFSLTTITAKTHAYNYSRYNSQLSFTFDVGDLLVLMRKKKK